MPEKEFIPLAKPLMDEREAAAARRAILSGWVTQGPEVAAFEKEFGAFVGADCACAVSSCTAALHLALLAVGAQRRDEIITVSHSFIATANSIRHCGAIPVFADIQPDTFNMDPSRIAEAITENTKAILCVHQMGMPCDLRSILDLAQRHGLPVIEDAACAVGSEIQWAGEWEKIGKPHGDIACFSLHPRKIISTGDGGVITTANGDWDRKFRLWRHQGMSISDAQRHRSKPVLWESYPVRGFNYRLTDIQAAVGREQLLRLPEIFSQRRMLARRYRERLADMEGLVPPSEPSWARSNWQSFCVRLPQGSSQREIMRLMREKGVATGRGIMCAHREEAYRDLSAWNCAGDRTSCGCRAGTCRRLEESENARDTALLLPLYPQMTESDQDRVIAVLRKALE